MNWREVKWALWAWAGLAASVALLKVLGFLLSFALFTFFLVYVVYRRPLGAAVAVAACTTAGFYVVFPVGLTVELPLGWLGF